MKRYTGVLLCGCVTASCGAQEQPVGPVLQEYPLNGTFQMDPYVQYDHFDPVWGIIYDHISDKYSTYQGFSFGSSASMGDFDGDGEMDLAIGIQFARDLSHTNPHNDGGFGLPRSAAGAGAVCILYGPMDDWHRSGGSMLDDDATYPPEVSSGHPEDDGWVNLFWADNLGYNDSLDSHSGITEIRSAIIYSEAGAQVLNTQSYNLDPDDNIIINGNNAKFTRTGETSAEYYAWDAQAADQPTGSGSSGTWNFIQDGTGTESKTSGDAFGYSICFVGDVDADGKEDLLIGAPNFNRESDRAASLTNHDELFRQYFYEDGEGKEVHFSQNAFGAAFLIFGDDLDSQSDARFSVDQIGLGSGYEVQGVVFKGDSLHTKVGQDVRNASIDLVLEDTDEDDILDSRVSGMDMNGDIYADFVIGAQSWDPGNHRHFVADDPSTTGIDEEECTGVITSTASLDPRRKNSGVGACFIIYGGPRSGWDSQYELPYDLQKVGSGNPSPQSFFPNGGAVIYGNTNFAYLGYSGFAGDFDGNGYADVLIGSPHEDYGHVGIGSTGTSVHGRSNTGAAYILFGYPGSDAPQGEYFTNPSGATFKDTANGGVYTTAELATITSRNNGSGDPVAIKLVGTINQQRDYPTAISSPNSSNHPDFKDEFDWTADWDYGGTTDSVSDIVSADEAGSEFGWAVMAAGDVNGDGKTDVLIGAPDFIVGNSVEDNGINERGGSELQPDSPGKVYLVFGYDPTDSAITAITTDRIFEIDDLVDYSTSSMDDHGGDPTHSVLLQGEHVGDNFGWHVFCAGDTNLDGYADFIIGANEADVIKMFDHDDDEITADVLTAIPTSGAAYLVYGGDHFDAGSTESDNIRQMKDLGTSSAFPGAKIYGDTLWADEWGLGAYDASNKYNHVGKKPGLGTWVFGGFDMNGDGYDDFGVCAPNAGVPMAGRTSTSPNRTGAVYIFYGGNLLKETNDHLVDDDTIDCSDLALFQAKRSVGTAPDLNNDGIVDDDDEDYLRLNFDDPEEVCD